MDVAKGDFVVIEEHREYDLVEVLEVTVKNKMETWQLRQVRKLNHNRSRDDTWSVAFNHEYENSPYRCWAAHDPENFGDLSPWMGR